MVEQREAGGSGLIFAVALDGEGGGSELDWNGVANWSPDQGVLWIHMDYTYDDAVTWLTQHSGLDSVTCGALTQSDPRPRCVPMPGALMLVVRVINVNDGAEPEDMISVRVWLDAHRVITLRHRRVNALKAVREKLTVGIGPVSVGDLLVSFTGRVLDRIGLVVDALESGVDDMEDRVLGERRGGLRPALARLRRQAIALRRYIAPQRDVFNRLQHERADFLGEVDRLRMRECADRLTRLVEDLDAARDRASVTQEELANRLSESMNQRLYVLSVVAAMFMPLGVITSLLGVNTGGMPGVDSAYGFWILCGVLVAVTGGQLWVFRRLGWL